jgi:hypothetical protein
MNLKRAKMHLQYIFVRLLATRSIGTSLLQFRLMLTLDHAQRSKKKTIVLGLEKKGIGGIF